jgi:hypothetical protein
MVSYQVTILKLCFLRLIKKKKQSQIKKNFFNLKAIIAVSGIFYVLVESGQLFS